MLILISAKIFFSKKYFFTLLCAVTYLLMQTTFWDFDTSVEESTKPSALVVIGIMVHSRSEAENFLGGQAAYCNKVCDVSLKNLSRNLLFMTM